ncbi:DUF1570 domain-containing protein [Leptolyngbya sp. 15MV]|nr:DUF1570 domain-containing protein [Leptolyngbya sp. 15MV]
MGERPPLGLSTPRRIAWLLALLASVVALSPDTKLGRLTRAAAFAAVAEPPAEDIAHVLPRSLGRELLDLGVVARQRGDRERADELFRAAWRDPQTRSAATAELWSLHRRAGLGNGPRDPDLTELRRLLGPRFRRHASPNFVVLSDATPSAVNERLAVLERAREQFFRASARMGLYAIPHRERLVAVLFADHDDFRAFAHTQDGVATPWIGGYFSARANRIVFFLRGSPEHDRGFADASRTIQRLREEAGRASVEGAAQRAGELLAQADHHDAQLRSARDSLGRALRRITDTKTIHEAIHLLAFNTGVQCPSKSYPFWLSEGLAMAFEAEDTDSPFGPDEQERLIRDRLNRYDQLVLDGKDIAIERLVGLDGLLHKEEAVADAIYAQTHALFLHLARRQPAAVGELSLWVRDDIVVVSQATSAGR